MDKATGVENAISIPYRSLQPVAEVAPASIVGATISWTPAGRPRTDQIPDVILDAKKDKQDPVVTSKDSRILETLGIAVTRDFGEGNSGGELRQVARTTLFFGTFQIPGTSSTNPLPTDPETVSVSCGGKVLQSTRTSMNTALDRLSG